MSHRNLQHLVACSLLGLLLNGCEAGGAGRDNGAPPNTLPPPTEVPGDCDQNIDERIAEAQGYCYETGFFSHDGTEIAMQIFVPAAGKLQDLAGLSVGGSTPGYAPLIVHSHGFGGTKAEDFSPPGTELDRQIALDLWQSGYWVISYTQRGFGGVDGSERASGGQIGLMSPDKEGWDFVRLVDWAICHLRENAPLHQADAAQDEDPEFDGCGQQWGASLLATDAGNRLQTFDDDVALGTLGYSYGGGFQFNAQSVDPRVDAMLPMGTWHDLRSSLHPNDTPKSAWITIMTAFSSSVPGVGGGNGQALPEIIVSANTEAEGVNLDPADFPYNKPRQVSTSNANILAPNGAVAYCDGHAAYYAEKFADPDGEPVDLQAANRPAHAVTSRIPRADLFMIQGHGDTLFPMGEGYDNARCFENAGRDVVFLSQSSGHPLPYLGPDHYAGVDTSMYLDEIVHCGIDAQGRPQRYNTRQLGHQWFDSKLLGRDGFTSAFRACITQANADTGLVLDTADPYFSNGTSNSANTAYQWSREGAAFPRIGDIPVGGTRFELPATSLNTGPGSLGQEMDSDPRVVFIPLLQAQTPTVLAGLPTAELEISRANPLADEIFYMGIALQRCQTRPQADQDPAQCQDLSPELLHFQAMPVRVFATDAIASNAQYPQDDPRNFAGQASGHYYPIRFGDNPEAPAKGRLHGVSARLYPGDQVGLMLMAEHPTFTAINSAAPGQVSLSGSVELPILSLPNPVPGTTPDYVIERE